MQVYANSTYYVLLYVFIAFIVLILCAYITYVAINKARRNTFYNEYNVALPRSVKVKIKKYKEQNNSYHLKFPYWLNSKRDGTADKRYKNNKIIWQTCELYVENYLLTSKRPDQIIKTVEKLRLQGVEIGLCYQESKKANEILKRKKALVYNEGIQGIIDLFSTKPTDFEKLCANLFESMGYETKLTPQTNDGGYDITLLKSEETAIVECKCFSINHKVGRPAIQKLVGANSLVMADKMIFVTTSDFSSSAISYAQEVGVDVINGNKLFNLLNEQGFITDTLKTTLSISDYQLKISDLKQYVPKDIYYRCFM